MVCLTFEWVMEDDDGTRTVTKTIHNWVTKEEAQKHHDLFRPLFEKWRREELEKNRAKAHDSETQQADK